MINVNKFRKEQQYEDIIGAGARAAGSAATSGLSGLNNIGKMEGLTSGANPLMFGLGGGLKGMYDLFGSIYKGGGPFSGEMPQSSLPFPGGTGLAGRGLTGLLGWGAKNIPGLQNFFGGGNQETFENTEDRWFENQYIPEGGSGDDWRNMPYDPSTDPNYPGNNSNPNLKDYSY